MATKFVGESISSVKWVPNEHEKFCVTAGQGHADRSLSLWECDKEKISLVEKEKLTNNTTSLSFLSASTFALAYESPESGVEVWNLSNGKMSCRTKLTTAHTVTTALDTSDHMITSVGEEGHVQVHLADQVKPLFSAKCEMTLHAVQFYLSQGVLVGTGAGQLQLFDTRTSEKCNTPSQSLSSELIPVLSIAVHHAQPSIVAGSRSDGGLLVWDMRHQAVPLATFAGHDSAVWEVQFEKDRPDNLYTCSEDGQLLLWNGAALSGVGGILGGAGGVSPWLTPEISHQKMDIFNLLGSDNKLSVNSFDVMGGLVVCGGERQTLFCVDSCDG